MNAEELRKKRIMVLKKRIMVLKKLKSSHVTRKLQKEALSSRKNVRRRTIPMVRSRSA